jgi:hypothetical protein
LKSSCQNKEVVVAKLTIQKVTCNKFRLSSYSQNGCLIY